MSDKEAELTAMILTIILMIMMLLAILAMAGVTGGGGGGARSVDDVGIGAARSADDTGSAASAAAKGGKAGAPGGAGGGIKVNLPKIGTRGNSILTKLLQSIQKRATAMAKDPFLSMVLVQGLALTAEPSLQIGYNVQQVHRLKSQIEITEDIAQGQALLQLLGQMIPGFDVNMDALQDDSKKFMEFISSLMTLFAGMVDSASKLTTGLHQTA